jgi:hypothetical protein
VGEDSRGTPRTASVVILREDAKRGEQGLFEGISVLEVLSSIVLKSGVFERKRDRAP